MLRWARSLIEICAYLVVLDTDVLFRLEGQVAELEELWVEAHIRQLEDFLNFDREVCLLHLKFLKYYIFLDLLPLNSN